MPRYRSTFVTSLFPILAGFLFFPIPALGEANERHALIIVGSGGESTYARTFESWSERLERFLEREGETPRSHIVRLQDAPTTPALQPTRPRIQSTIEAMQHQIHAADELLIFLIGHGSHIAGESRFNIPGKDLTAAELNAMLAPLDAARLIVVNTTASSAGFINELSAEGRIIVTATKSVNERNATRFMESFLQGLEDGSADGNRDGRISLLEATHQAARLTRDWFQSQGYLVTEHPLIDDNGDGLGTRLIPEEEGDPAATEYAAGEGVRLDGALAGRYFLKDFSFPPEVPRSLARRYIETLDAVEVLKSEKHEFGPEDYRARLEPLLIDAALTHRKIREIIKNTQKAGTAGATQERKAESTNDVPGQ